MYSENIHLSARGIKFTDKHGRTLTPVMAAVKVRNRINSWGEDFTLFLLHLAFDNVPSHMFRQWLFRMLGGRIGRGSALHMNIRFFRPSGVSIGRDSIIGFAGFLDGRDRLTIGDHVDIASEVMIYNSEHNIHSADFAPTTGPVEIGDYVFIGPRAIILPGVKIGRGAVVAAGAVVTRNVPDFAIVGGVPAAIIGERKNKQPDYRLGRARLFQ